MAQDNVTILRVQLDEGATEQQLKKLVLDIEATKKAQQALTAARKADTITADEYAKQVVDLRTQLRGQTQEQTNLTKNLELYRTAVNGVAGSYDQAQAQLTLAQRQFRGLEGSLEDTTEASQALSGVVRDLRGQLKETDANSLDQFFRSIGDYPKPESLTPLIQQLVKLEETVKSGALTAEQAAQADAAVIGYKQRIAQAGAQEGKSYEDTTALVKSYGDAIRPATAELVKLEAEQRQVVESGKATGEQVAQIGFRFGAAQKSIKDATEALKEVPEAAKEGAKETKGLGAGLLDAARSSDKLGGAVDVLTTAKEKYTAAAELAKVATAGEVTVLGALKLALIATGLGALVVVLGLVISGLSKSQAVTDLLSRKMAALGGFIQPIINLGAELGEKLVAAADNPKQAFSDLVDFLGTNLLNRLKGFVQIVQDVSKGNFGKLADDFIQIGTGITDATAKAQAFGKEMATSALSAEAIEKENQRIREAERALNVERDQSRAKIEGLKKASDDTSKSVAARTAAAKEAARIENALLAEQLKLQDDKVRNLRAEQALKKSLSTEDKDKLAELLREQANVQQESLTLQTELQNKINSLVQEGIDKSIAGRAQALALEKALLDKRLAQVQQNSDAELSIRQQLLNNARAAELNVKNLTVAQKKAIDVKYETDSLALSLDFNRRRLQAALQAEADLTSARLAQQQEGSIEALQAQTDQIENQRRLAIAGLAANADNTAKIAVINAQAEQQRRQLEYQQATADLQRYLDGKREAIELDYAKGVIQEGEYQRRLAAVAKAGTDAQTVINSDYRQSNAENAQQAAQLEIEVERRHTAEVKRTEEVKQEIKKATIGAAQAATDTIIQLYGEESGAGVAALAIKKVLGLAEIALNLQKVLSANTVTAAQIKAFIPPPAGVALGIAYQITADALAIASAAASAASILKLQRGGLIAEGPSHERGGIHLYRQGRATGIEIEGGEAVLTKNVAANPLLLSLASTVNQLAGGRALAPGLSVPRMALGGIAYPALAQQQIQGSAGAGAIDYDRLAQALAKVNIYTKTQETMKSIEKVKYTQSLGSN
jgi:hypothetical protein